MKSYSPNRIKTIANILLKFMIEITNALFLRVIIILIYVYVYKWLRKDGGRRGNWKKLGFGG